MLTVTDQFCGAGGSSLGAVGAGTELVLAMNHWPKAIDTHGHNFPEARHACVDVACVDPSWYPRTDILITSPECKAHSYARGRPKDDPSLFDPRGDMAAERSRATMWDVPRFSEYHDYRIVVVENVVQAVDWGPRSNPGSQFRAWLFAMQGLDYDYRALFLNSAFFPPTPQSRDRMYVVFWKHGQRAPDLDFTPPAWCPSCASVVYAVQRWKEPRSPAARRRFERLGFHSGTYGAQYVYACPTCGSKTAPAITPAAHAIDWTLPAQRIGDRARPLKPATLERIRRGLVKLSSRRPAIVPLDHLTRDGKPEPKRLRDVGAEPYPTQTGQQEQGLVVQAGGPCVAARLTACEPTPTILSRERFGLVVSNMRHNAPRVASEEPAHCVTTGSRLYLLDAALVPLRRNGTPRVVGEEPAQTVCASGNHHALVLRQNGSPDGPVGKMGHARDVDAEPVGAVTTKPGPSLVLAYNSTSTGRETSSEALPACTTVDPYALVEGDTPDVDDCAFRMLEPHEIGAAMAMDRHVTGKTYIVIGTKRDQVKQYGNAVTPPVMKRIIGRVAASLDE